MIWRANSNHERTRSSGRHLLFRSMRVVRLPGFPAFCSVVFWQDFAQWRNAQAGTRNANVNVPERSIGEIPAVPRNGKNLLRSSVPRG
jgi:hypothetical protein